MLHKGIPFTQVEGSKYGVNEKQMQGTHGRTEAEQGCWRASMLGALDAHGKALIWIIEVSPALSRITLLTLTGCVILVFLCLCSSMSIM